MPRRVRFFTEIAEHAVRAFGAWAGGRSDLPEAAAACPGRVVLRAEPLSTTTGAAEAAAGQGEVPIPDIRTNLHTVRVSDQAALKRRNVKGCSEWGPGQTSP